MKAGMQGFLASIVGLIIGLAVLPRLVLRAWFPAAHRRRRRLGQPRRALGARPALRPGRRRRARRPAHRLGARHVDPRPSGPPAAPDLIRSEHRRAIKEVTDSPPTLF
jgi:hypothetical protein